MPNFRRISPLEYLDKVLRWEILAILVLTECGIVFPLIVVALVLGLPDAVLSEEVPIYSSTYFMATLVVPAGNWLLFASTTAANSL